MRILHVVPTLDPECTDRPSAWMSPRLAAAQAALSGTHAVHILTYEAAGAADRTHKATAGIPHFSRVTVHRLALEAKPRDRAKATAAAASLTELAGQVDVIHLHEARHPMARPAARAAAKRKIPLVLTPYGTLSPSYRPSADTPRDRFGLERKRLARKSAAVLALSQAERRDLELAHPKAALRVIPGGIFREDVLPLPGRGLFRGEHKELGSDPILLYMGPLHPAKGLDLLVDAFAQVVAARRDTRLVLIGPDQGARSDLIARADRRGIDNRVHIYPPENGKARIHPLSDATVFCLPSRDELFATPVVEAMAASLPVVISEACNFPDVVGAQAGKVCLLEQGSLARVLLEMLGNPGLRTAMGARGKELALTAYVWPTIAPRVIEAYGLSNSAAGAATATPKNPEPKKARRAA